MEKVNKIDCPKCGFEIDVNQVIYQQIEQKSKLTLQIEIQKFENDFKRKESELLAKVNKLNAEKEKIDEERAKLNEMVELQVSQKLKSERAKIEKIIKEKLADENETELNALKEELKQKAEQAREFNKAKIEIERLKREKDDLADTIALQKEKEFTQKLKEEREKVKLEAEENNLFKIRELEKKLKDQMELAESMKKKAEQGSMQLQGEIQELELENIIESLKNFDRNEEVKKGQRGADLIHIVCDDKGVECGKILYESKRTKNYDKGWIAKLKDDNQFVNADVLVLATEAMPDGNQKFFYDNGVWVCSFKDIRGLIIVLRHTLIEMSSLKLVQQNKSSKMEMLYSYLTSNEFRQQFESMLDGFKSLQDSYHEEKMKMQKIWKEREKQFEKIMTNAVSFYGSLKGIAGSSIQDIKMLE